VIAAELVILHDLEPGFADTVRDLIAYGDGLWKGSGYRLTIPSYTTPEVAGRRTAAQQAVFFRRRLTDCDGYQKLSAHQLGRAIHLGVRVRTTGSYVPYDRLPADELGRFHLLVAQAERMGMVWGGRWKRKDFEHFEAGSASKAAADDFYKPV
jgi:hypothetical protein